MDLTGRIGRKAPPKPGSNRGCHDQGHEHAADAVSQPLNVRAAGLGPLHGGNDMRQRGRFARRRHAHYQPTVDVDRAGVNRASDCLIHGHGFTSKHGFVHRRFPFRDFAVGGHTVAGSQHCQVFGLEFGDGHFRFGAIRAAPARQLRREVQQLAQRARGPRAHPRFQPMPQADERDDGGRLHEIDVAGRMAEQHPCAIGKSRRRAQRHEGVHVRAARFELTPCAAIKPGSGENLDHAGQREGSPTKPFCCPKPQQPFPDNQRHAAERPEPKVEPPPCEHGLAGFFRLGRLDRPAREPRLRHRPEHGGDIQRGAGRPTHGSFLRLEAHCRTLDPGHGLNGLGHMPRAVAARHAADAERCDLGGRSRCRAGRSQFSCLFHSHGLWTANSLRQSPKVSNADGFNYGSIAGRSPRG